MTDDRHSLTLAEIADRLALQDLLTRYAFAVDSRAWEQLREVFSPDAHIDFAAAGGYVGPVGGLSAWLDQALAPYRILQHFVSNARITLDVDRGKGRTYVHAVHGYKTESGMRFFSLGGEYLDDFVRTGDGWRIESRVLVARWFDGTAPAPRAATGQQGDKR